MLTLKLFTFNKLGSAKTEIYISKIKKMNTFDVIVVGAGPAGGQCARNLSKHGLKVLLVDRFKDFNENAFSSAGMTFAPMKEFNIPKDIIGACWDKFHIQCTQKEYVWFSEKDEGVVLDFGKLRAFLATETKDQGGTVLLGHQYIKKKKTQNGVRAYFNNLNTQEEVSFEAKLLVDATGPTRKVMYDNKKDLPVMRTAVGLEYLIEVDDETYKKYSKSLVFFLGYKWAIKGYSWIFPMGHNQLKVGSGKIHFPDMKDKKQEINVKELIFKVIHEYLKIDKYKILDKHGGTIKITENLEELYYQDYVVSIGDAVSSVNPLGGEGIKFAMQNANLASEYIVKYIRKEKEDFATYRKKWRKRYRLKWKLCHSMMRRVYDDYSDTQIEEKVKKAHNRFNMKTLIQIMFEFKYSVMIPRVIKYSFMKAFGR